MIDGIVAAQGPNGNLDTVEKQVEYVFAKLLLSELRKTTANSMFSGREMSMFQEMLDDVVAEQLADEGRFGIGHMIADGPLPSPAPSVQARAAAAYQPPVAIVDGHISSHFGRRTDPIHGQTRDHHGVDIAAPEGTPIRAWRSGEVVFAGDRGGYGNLIILRHADGSETRYAHCRDMKVRKGEVIGAGQTIGSVGQTGRATGPHLHFELRRDGEPVDPSEAVRHLKKISTPR